MPKTVQGKNVVVVKRQRLNSLSTHEFLDGKDYTTFFETIKIILTYLVI